MRMRYARLMSCLYVSILLASCGGSAVSVYNTEGKKIGSIRIVDDHNATIVSTYGEERGKVRGSLVRDDAGKRRGSIVERSRTIVIQNTDDDDVGTLVNGTDCYGKGQDIVGRISMVVRPEAAGAACLLFFLK